MRRHLLKDDGAHPYFTMDVLRPLPERVSKRQLPRLLEDVCAGLETLHAKGIVHRDVKPANILLANDGRAVLADLGVAHIADADLAKRLGDTRTPDPTLLNGGSFVGTPRYAAPEQLAGEAVTPATDVYALGVVIEELLDGKPPFPWNALVRRMTASRPLFRPQSIRQVRRGIRLVRAWPRILGLVAAAALGIAAVAIWQRARPDWIEVSSVPADVITLNGGRYIQARLRVQPIAIPPETNALTAANALEQQFQKMFATRYRRRPIRVQGAGTLKCPDVAGCEIHLAPGVTFITTGRFTPDGNLIKKPLPPADATREDPDAVGYPSFVVEKGARLVFTENDAYPRGLIRME